MDYETPASRTAKSVVSMFIGMLTGAVIAEVVANSLIEISFVYEFAIVFGIAFLLLGAALIWRIWTTFEDMAKRGFLLSFAFGVVLSGIFSFFLVEDWITMPAAAKVPMYALLGTSLSFSIVFSLTECINLGLLDKCCNTDFEMNPLISTKTQVYVVFGGTLLLGFLFGFLFGTLDVEDDDSRHTKFKEILVWSIPIGAGIGGILGFVNQWLRSEPKHFYTFNERSPFIITDENM